MGYWTCPTMCWSFWIRKGGKVAAMKTKFDDAAKEAAEYLLENSWILREKDPEVYQLIREREHVLRTYFMEKAGFRLVVHRFFARLEKVPVRPEKWMGMQEFRSSMDYVLFCLLLAYLESRNVDEQFLLSDLCQDLAGLYPEEGLLDWTIYIYRKSLVRVLQQAASLGIIRTVDGDIANFSHQEDQEVLYEVPLVSRYFLRSFHQEVVSFTGKEAFMEAELDIDDGEGGTARRHRVYRQLFLSPAMYSTGPEDLDFRYLRNFRNRIVEDMAQHTDMQFELYQNAAMLVAGERKAKWTLFPDSRAIADVALHFAALVRKLKEEQDIPLQYDGSVRLTPVDFRRWVHLCYQQYGHGWSKQHREANLNQLARDLLELLVEWQMAVEDDDTGVVSLKPLLARLAGRYPRDYNQETAKEAAEDGE